MDGQRKTSDSGAATPAVEPVTTPAPAQSRTGNLAGLAGLAGADTERVSDVAEVRAALATLPDELREVLIEVHIRQRPIVEVAEALGIPFGTVTSRTFYALRAMRRALERRGFPFPPPTSVPTTPTADRPGGDFV